MTDSIKHFTGFDISGKSEAELFDAAKEWELMWMPMGKGKLIDEILAKCEGNYIQPTFITDYPKSPCKTTQRQSRIDGTF
jgi:lysyl-tRNA synthetase class 2